MKNILKEKLKVGQVATGTFVGLGHPDVTEVLSGIGYDWLVIDGEHAPLGLETMQQMMQAMDSSKCTPIVRPQWNDMVIIKRVLESTPVILCITILSFLICLVLSAENSVKSVFRYITSP